MEQADAFGKTSSGKRIYAWRKETIERSFAEAKELHGLRYARMLGIRSMYEQSFLTAAVQNMKRIARAFRFPFSLLSLSIKGQFPRENRPFVGGLGGRENSLPLSILRTQNGFLTSCVLKSTNYRKFIETIICFAYNDIIRKR